MVNLELDRVCVPRKNVIASKITLISIFSIYSFPAYLVQTRTRVDLFGMVHKFSKLSMCRMRSRKFEERFEDSHRVKFPVMNFLSSVIKLLDGLKLLFPSLKGTLEGGREDKVCLRSVVVFSDCASFASPPRVRFQSPQFHTRLLLRAMFHTWGASP